MDNLEKLQQYANEKGYVNMTMSKRREVWQYGDTHYFTLNEYNPENNQNTWNIQQNTSNENQSDEVSVEDLPF